MPNLGTRLSDLRKRAGLKRAELAELAGLKAESHVGLIETGARKSPLAATLSGLARVLGTDVDYLLSGKGDPPGDRKLKSAVSMAREVANDAQKPTGS